MKIRSRMKFAFEPLGLALTLLSCREGVCAGGVCEFPAANCQIADQSGGRISSAGVVVCADDFQLARIGCCGGDTSGDGLVNSFDIDLFVDALRNGDQSCQADIDCSGHVDNFDIDHFIDVINAGDCSPCSGDGRFARLNELCWRGAAIDGEESETTFRVVIYSSQDGAPGDIACGPYDESTSTLTVISEFTGDTIEGLHPEREYRASHSRCFVERQRCYWVEISNTSLATTWLWEFSGSGNGRAWRDGVFTAGDFAFCLGDDLETDNICTEP
ncbi:MAG: hypothetical protein JNG88_03110 [Phycisphaerales bacterium]|nr:hypothetical protein [Phycisphaerales bacterium]